MSNKVVESKTIFDVKDRIWRGPKDTDVIRVGSKYSLGRSLLDILLSSPDHVSQICDNNGRTYTNEEIASMSIRVAQRLEDFSLQQEDMIGICASNSDFIAPLVFGALLNGAIISTLDPTFDKDGIRHTFSITKPKILFCDGKIYETVKAAIAEIGLDIPIYTMKDHLEGVGKIEEFLVSTGKEKFFKFKPLKLGSKQTAFILCSSGTTGLPKGVCLSHENLLSSFIFNFSKEDKLLCFSTLYWLSGLLSLVHGTLLNCTRVITDQTFSPECLLQIIERHKVNVLFTPPSQMARTIQSPEFKSRNLSSLETYTCGGSAVPFPGCTIITGYGMSEICGVCSVGVPSKPGANGQLAANIEVKIIDDSGKKLGISEQGEVCIRTAIRWPGYYGNKKATREIYDEEGWIHSGDIGYFDDEGNLLIVDRKKDILKYNNFHFSPSEIEEVIIQIPDVVEVCVCGIPDIIFSFLPAAAIIKVPNSSLTEDDVIKYVAERMAHFKHLRGGVYFMDEIPKTASGKNVRAKVVNKIEEMRNGRP